MTHRVPSRLGILHVHSRSGDSAKSGTALAHLDLASEYAIHTNLDAIVQFPVTLSRLNVPAGIAGSAQGQVKRFEGKTVLVTGATGGIGSACAHAFAREGAYVVLLGRNRLALERVQAELGEAALAFINDVVDIGATEEITNALHARNVRLDAISINTGIERFAPFAHATEALWNALFDTNVKGPYFQIQSLSALLNPGSAIVLNASINAHIGAPGSSIYAASKAALISLARTLSAELLPRGIRVNVVSPGPIETGVYDQAGMNGRQRRQTLARIRGLIPLGRLGAADEVAATVLHLASSESAFIVGSEIRIDGGLSQL